MVFYKPTITSSAGTQPPSNLIQVINNSDYYVQAYLQTSTTMSSVVELSPGSSSYIPSLGSGLILVVHYFTGDNYAVSVASATLNVSGSTVLIPNPTISPTSTSTGTTSTSTSTTTGSTNTSTSTSTGTTSTTTTSTSTSTTPPSTSNGYSWAVDNESGETVTLCVKQSGGYNNCSTYSPGTGVFQIPQDEVSLYGTPEGYTIYYANEDYTTSLQSLPPNGGTITIEPYSGCNAIIKNTLSEDGIDPCTYPGIIIITSENTPPIFIQNYGAIGGMTYIFGIQGGALQICTADGSTCKSYPYSKVYLIGSWEYQNGNYVDTYSGKSYCAVCSGTPYIVPISDLPTETTTTSTTQTTTTTTSPPSPSPSPSPSPTTTTTTTTQTTQTTQPPTTTTQPPTTTTQTTTTQTTTTQTTTTQPPTTTTPPTQSSTQNDLLVLAGVGGLVGLLIYLSRKR